MTKSRLTNATLDDQGAMFTFEGATQDELATEIAGFFTAKGYRIESGDALNGMWGTGNAVLRAIFGGFVKRYKFAVTTNGTGGHLTVALTKGMSGALGGVMGWAKMKKEVAALSTAMKAHFGG